MKVSDNEILREILKQHLQRIPSQVISHYITGKYGLRDISKNQPLYISLHPCNRKSFDLNLSSGQLLNRIKTLIAAGHLKGHFYYGSRLSSFWLDNQVIKDAIITAQEFWLSQGVPSGFDPDKQGMRCIKLNHYEQLRQQCVDELMEQFYNCGKRHAA